MTDLGIDNIVLNPNDLWDNVDDTKVSEDKNTNESNNNVKDNSDLPLPSDLKPEDLFDIKDTKIEESTDDDEKEDNNTDKSQVSKSENVYQDLLKSLIEDGVFTDEDTEVKDADSFKAYIDKQVTDKLEEYQKEIKHALDVGVDTSEVQLYNQAMSWLNGYTNDIMEGATKEAQQSRMNLIYRDYLNKGFNEEKAKKLTIASAQSGSDIEDAKEALESCKDFYTSRYNSVLEEAENEEKERVKLIQKQSEELKKNILEKENLFNGVQIDKTIRQKAYNAMTKVVGKDSEGMDVTAIQKYADDNPVEFRTVLGLMYAMTDGFKNFDKIFNKAVDKKVNSRLDEFTKKITSQPHSSEGSLSYKNGHVKELFDAGWKPLV